MNGEIPGTPNGDVPSLGDIMPKGGVGGSCSEGYRVKLEIFEGPLDLLLYLIRRDEIDIYDIPMTNITGQYMEYLDIMRMLDLDIASDFLVMAATLIYIKSRMLLPPEEREEEEEEEYDPRMDLVRQLLEYRKFKDVATQLQAMEEEREKLFRRAEQDNLPKGEQPALDVGIFELLSAFSEVLKRSDAGKLREIVEDRFTVSDRIVYILGMLRKSAAIKFYSLFTDAASRTEIVVTFLALLELMRSKKVRVRQERAFDPIEIITCSA
ncbi:MAG: segregation/condensation protein A [Candidatus Tritonobacter lacicola]|nr:segregation/condensation protein A [Candidatus Tritonobacter lacicola]